MSRDSIVTNSSSGMKFPRLSPTRLLISCLVIICLLSILSGVDSLYADEIGLNDWTLSHVGRPTHVVLPSKNDKRRHIVVATEQGALAAINVKTGGLVWRRLFSVGDGIQDVRQIGKTILTLSGNRVVSGWDSVSGGLLWNFPLPLPQSGAQLTWRGFASAEGGRAFAVGLEASNGQAVVRAVAFDVRSGVESNDVQEVGEAGDAFAGSLDWNDAAVIAKYTQIIDGAARGLLVFNPNSGTVTLLNVGATGATKVDVQEHITGTSSGFAGVAAGSSCAALSAGPSAAIILKAEKSSLSVASSKSVNENEVVSCATTDDGNIVTKLRVGKIFKAGEVSVEVLGGKTSTAELEGDEILQGSVKFGLSWSASSGDEEGSTGDKVWNTLVLYGNDDLALARNGDNVWVRHEGLATATDAVFVDLPAAEHVRRHDQFGFNKLAVVVTSTPSLVALHTGNEGKVVWAVNLRAVVKREIAAGGVEADITEVVVRRFTPTDATEKGGLTAHAVQHHLIIWVKATTAGGAEYDVVLRVNGFDGGLITAKVFTTPLVHVGILPYPFKRELTKGHQGVAEPMLIVDEKFGIHYEPEVDVVRTQVEKFAPYVFFAIANEKEGKLTGYGLTQNATRIREDWHLSFPLGETIETVAYAGDAPLQLLTSNVLRIFTNTSEPTSPTSNQKFNTFGFKYINPNLIVVVTSAPAPKVVEGDKKKSTGATLQLYIIDGVTGGVVEYFVMHQASGPVHVQFAENLVMVHYLNTKMMRYFLSVHELFEDNPLVTATVSEAVVKGLSGRREAQSALTTPPPLIERRQLPFPSAISATGATVSAQGATNKMLLVATSLGQIVGIDTRMLEKGKAVPYNTKTVLSYNITLAGTAGIATAPTRLESTSHVLAFGMDIFYTRVSPSQQYDMLSESFDRITLVAVVLGLIVGLFLAKAYAQRKDLARAWR